MTAKIEARGYDNNSTPEEIQAILERVYMHSPGVMMYREVPIQTVFQLDLFEKKMNELAASLESYVLIIDLLEAKPPSAAIRQHLRKIFGSQTKIRSCGVFTGKNFMLNIAAKFVLTGIGLPKVTVHKTLDEALEAVKQ